MKCPYRTKVIHQPEHTDNYVKHYAQDITEFSDCMRSECPFYYTTESNVTRKITEHCRRANAERK